MATGSNHARRRHLRWQDTRTTHGTGGFDATVFDASESAYGNLLDYGGIGQVEMPGQIPGGNLQDGSIDGGLKITPGSIDITPFASDIRPVILVTALPSLPDPAYPIGQFVYKTNDVPPRLYKNVANVWTAAIGPNDIQADSITAGQIAAGAISASELAAGAVTVGKLGDGVGSNFAANPSFEIMNGQAVNTYGVPIFGWDTNPSTGAQGYAGSASARFSDASPKHGVNSVQLRHDAVSSTRKEVESVVIPIQGNRRFGMRVWVRGNGGNNAAATASIGLRGVTSTGARVEAATLSTLVVGTNTTWQRLSLVDTGATLGFAPTSAVSTHLTARLCLENGGSVGDSINFDGVEVYYLDDDVTHASGNVQIDSTGITINNGKLTFKDAAGTLAMDGGGFGGTWQRFLANGLFNSDFFAPAPTLSTQFNNTTNPIPWWNYTRASGTALTGDMIADAATASGNKVRFQMASGAAGDNAYIEQIVPVNGNRGQSFAYHLAATYEIVAGITGTGAKLYFEYQHLKKDAVTTTGSNTTRQLSLTGATGTLLELTTYGATLTYPPADAYYVRIRVGLKRDVATNTQVATVYLYEARIARMPQILGVADTAAAESPATISKDTSLGGFGDLKIAPNGQNTGALFLSESGGPSGFGYAVYVGDFEVTEVLEVDSYAHSHPLTTTFSASGTYTKSAKMHHILVEVIGSGGGGGGTATCAAGESACAAGGGAGGYARKIFSAADLAGAASFTVTVGNGGAGGTAGANNGSNGGTVSFSGTGITTVQSTGGNGGSGSTATSGNQRNAGGIGGDGTGGDTNFIGGDGGGGVVFAGVPDLTGMGADGPFGGGARQLSASAGSAGNTYGAGGSGATQGSTGSARAGGAGAKGCVIVTEFFA